MTDNHKFVLEYNIRELRRSARKRDADIFWKVVFHCCRVLVLSDDHKYRWKFIYTDAREPKNTDGSDDTYERIRPVCEWFGWDPSDFLNAKGWQFSQISEISQDTISYMGGLEKLIAIADEVDSKKDFEHKIYNSLRYVIRGDLRKRHQRLTNLIDEIRDQVRERKTKGNYVPRQKNQQWRVELDDVERSDFDLQVAKIIVARYPRQFADAPPVAAADTGSKATRLPIVPSPGEDEKVPLPYASAHRIEIVNALLDRFGVVSSGNLFNLFEEFLPEWLEPDSINTEDVEKSDDEGDQTPEKIMEHQAYKHKEHYEGEEGLFEVVGEVVQAVGRDTGTEIALDLLAEFSAGDRSLFRVIYTHTTDKGAFRAKAAAEYLGAPGDEDRIKYRRKVLQNKIRDFFDSLDPVAEVDQAQVLKELYSLLTQGSVE